MASGDAAGDSFGALLRRYRQAAVLSQEELAERAGLSVGAVSALERGQRTLPRPDTVALLAQALGLAAADRAAFAAAARPQPAAARVGHDPETAHVTSPAPPRSPLSSAPLPLALTDFIGRAQDLAALQARLLDPRTRLLTLTGPGGSGKTRLAVEVARLVEPAFPDGVAFVALAALTEPELLLPAIAQSLGLHETPGRTPLETLQAGLADTRLLLILDNCEQLVAAAPDVAALLVTVPGIRVLATSRTRLALAGERIYPVNPLQVPSPAKATNPATLAQIEAVTLFVARAQDALPTFTLSTDNALPVAAICARLDGLPLAIELAAARSRHLAPAALLKRLDSSLALLTGGPRNLPQRHQTLRETIAWSYVLLDAQGQALFRRLGVFAGGCTVEAADVVCRAPEGLRPLEGDMLLGLSALADQSLLVVGEDLDGEPRFTLLETIRTYTLEQLAAAGELDLLRHRHLAWCSALAEEVEPQLTGPEQEQWLARLETEHDNLRAALGWASESGAGELGVRLAGALYRFWYVRGHLTEGRRWLHEVLAQQGVTNVPPALRAGALRGAGNLALEQGDYTQAQAFYEESLALYREIGDTRGMSTALNSLGLGARIGGDYARARALHEESLVLCREIGDARGIAIALGNLGTVLRAQGDNAAARVRFEESLAFFRTVGDTLSIAGLLHNLGNAALDQGSYDRAKALYEESLTLRQELGDKYGTGLALTNLGMVAYRQGDYGRARALHAESLVLQRELGDRPGLLESLAAMAEVAGAQDQPQRGARLWGAVDSLRDAMGSPYAPDQRVEYEQATAALRAVLGAEAYATAWRAGKAMTLEEAIAFALEPN